MEHFNKIVDAHNKMMEAMSLYADNKMTKLNFYNGLKEVEKYQMEMSMYKLNNVPDIAKEYTSSVADTAFFSQQVAKKLMNT